MYCKNCGHELSEDAKFCQKCGNAVTPLSDNSSINSSKPEHTESNISGVTPNEQPKKTQKQGKENILKRYINRYFNRWKQCKQEKFKGRKNICWTVANAFILFVVIYNLVMCFHCNRDLNGFVYYRSIDGTYASASNRLYLGYYKYGIYTRPLLGKNVTPKHYVRIVFKTYEVKSVGIYKGNLTALSNTEYFSWSAEDPVESFCHIELSSMPKVGNVDVHCGHIRVDAVEGHTNLQILRLRSENAHFSELDYNVISLYEDFPKLMEMTIKNVYPYQSSTFSADKLTGMNLELSNDYLVQMMHYSIENIYDENRNIVGNYYDSGLTDTMMYIIALPDTHVSITHTVEDLYGTWIYRDSSTNEVFSITFQDNGYIKISDGLGIVGVDLFTFSEIDDNTLLLKAETENPWGELLSFNMPYELYGGELHLSIYGYEIDLTNEERAQTRIY